MIILNTRPWRRIMAAFLIERGLPPAGKGKNENGWTTETSKPFGNPGRHVIKRIDNQLEVLKLITHSQNDGTLNSHVQAALKPPLTMGEKAVAYGMTQVGVHESPWGSNSGKDVERYQSSTKAYHTYWCASLVWYCWDKAGYNGVKSAGAWASTDTIGTRVPLSKAQVGYPVSFDIGNGHVGMYLSHTSTMVKTLDGNTSDQVAIRERPISEIHAICRPLGG